MDSQHNNLMYLYDLPKDKISSVKIAEAFKRNGITIGSKKPMIKRDIFKPFYSAILQFQDVQMFALAKENMKYFEIEGCHIRSLPFETDQRSKKAKDANNNVFFKLPKDGNKAELTYQYLEDRFAKYGNIKKCKIPMNNDNTSKGFAYICYEEEEGVKNCLADKANVECSAFNQGEKVSPDMNITQLYFKNIPLEMGEDKVKPMFTPFGDIKSFTMKQSEKG